MNNYTKIMEDNPIIFCKCGCGKTRLKFDRRGREREYIFGHYTKTEESKLSKKSKRVNPLIPCACGCGTMIHQYLIEGKNDKYVKWTYPVRYVKGHYFNLKENREKLSKLRMGENNPFYGKKHSEKTREIIGKSSAERKYSDISRKKMSDSKKMEWADENSLHNKNIRGKTYEEIHGVEEAKRLKKLRGENSTRVNIGKKMLDSTKKKKSISMIEKWKDENYIKKNFEGRVRAKMGKPNKVEKMISAFLIDRHLPFIFTGDGTFLIGNKNPDFVDKENKIAIEVYYDYYKIKVFGSFEKYESDRIKYFAERGWKVIFIRVDEIRAGVEWRDILVNRINEVKNVRQ